METKDDLKEIDVKNRSCYYFDDIIAIRDIEFGHDKTSYKRFYKINGYIKVSDGIRYLVIFEYLTYDEVHNRIR